MNVDVKDIKANIDFNYSSLYLFGSYARCDFNKDSDIDILLVVDSYKRRFEVGKYSYSPYTLTTLKKMAEEGSLFILHLIQESKKLEGDDIIHFVKDNFKRKSSYESYREELRKCLPLLDISETKFNDSNSRFLRFQKYLLRSFLYSLSTDNGFNKFNINSVLEHLELKSHQKYFTDNWISKSEYRDYNKLNSQIEEIFGSDIKNLDGSIEAVIVNNFELNNLVYKLGIGFLKHDFNELGYENIFINE